MPAITRQSASLVESDTAEAQVRAEAHPNIALVKYWGKRDFGLNLPAVGSVSITLDTLASTTQLCLVDEQSRDQLLLNGEQATSTQTKKLETLVQYFRNLSGSDKKVQVTSDNNFPTAAGLASSASGYAALVRALDKAFATQLSASQLSAFARIGSGSAARSLFGGFAQMHLGKLADGTDSVASQVLQGSEWPLEVAVAIASESAKDVSSTVGMESTRTTSAFYQPWLDTQHTDIEQSLEAIKDKDFATLADVAEYSCLKMHGLMLSARPGLVYWNSTTVACIHAVRTLRADGVPVFFTIDAGPQLKAVCAPGFGEEVACVLEGIVGVSRVLRTGLGTGARVLAEPC